MNSHTCSLFFSRRYTVINQRMHSENIHNLNRHALLLPQLNRSIKNLVELRIRDRGGSSSLAFNSNEDAEDTHISGRMNIYY